MLVVDVNALETVDALNLSYDVVLNGLDAVDGEHVVGVEHTLGYGCSLFDEIALIDDYAIAVGNCIFALVGGLFVGDDHLAVALDVLNADAAGDFADDTGALGLSRLEKLFNTGKTLGDVLGAGNTAGVEGTHGELGTGLAYRLGGDDTDGLTGGNLLAVGKVGAVALFADAVFGAAVEHRTDLDPFDSGLDDSVGVLVGHHVLIVHKEVAVLVVEILDEVSAHKALGQRLDNVLAFLDVIDLDTDLGAAVVLTDDNILRNVDQTTGQITRVGGTKGGVGKSLTGAAGGNEVFENVKTLAVVCTDRSFDRTSRGVGDKSAHTGKLTNLVHGASGSRIGHHVDGVVFVKIVLKGGHNVVGGLIPNFDDKAVTLVVAYETSLKVLGDFVDVFLGIGNELLLGGRNKCIADGDGYGTDGGIMITGGLDFIEHLGGDGGAVNLDAAVDDLAEHTLAYLLGDGIALFVEGKADFKVKLVTLDGSVHKTEVLRNGIVEDYIADGGVHKAGNAFALGVFAEIAHLNGSVQLDCAVVIGHHGLVSVAEYLAGTLFLGLDKSQIVGAENHVLGGHADRLSVGGLEQVVGGEHEQSCLGLSLCRKGNVNGHLVAVEVGVVSGADQGVELKRAAFHKHRFKCLNTETVKRRGAVEQHGVFLDNGFESVPDLVLCALDHLSCLLNVGCGADFHKSLHDKGLEQLESHLFGQAALIHFKLRTDDDNRTAGIVDALTEQVLTETSLLTLKHIGKGFKRTVVGSGDRAASSAVFDEGVDGLLEHSLFVSNDYVGSVELEKSFKTVVAVDNAAVEVVQIRGGETAAVQLNHGAKIGGNDRHNVKNHPLGAVTRQAEGLDNVKAL